VGNTLEEHEHGKVLLLGDPSWTDYAGLRVAIARRIATRA
jgi:hypothetical protein